MSTAPPDPSADASPQRDDGRDAARRAAVASLRWIARPAAVGADAEGAPDVRDGQLNLCFNALDRHVVAGRSDDTALVTDVAGAVDTWSWARLLEDVASLAGALRVLGVTHRGPVVVALPPGPDAVVALLACLRLGAVAHLVPATSTAEDLAAVVERAAPPVLLTAGPVAWREALAGTGHQVGTVVVRQPAEGSGAPAELLEPRDLDWGLVARAGRDDPAPCERVASQDPAYALPVGAGHTTGPPGPAGPVGPVATGAAAVAAAQQGAELGLGPGQRWWSGLDPATAPGVGWGLLAPLLAGATLVVSDAVPAPPGEPDPVAAAHHVTGTARALARREGATRVEARTETSTTGEATVHDVWWRDGMTLPG